MQIVAAGGLLTEFASGVIALHMARELIRRRADLSDDVSVIHSLAVAGFGVPSIRALRRRAVVLAHARRADQHEGAI